MLLAAAVAGLRTQLLGEDDAEPELPPLSIDSSDELLVSADFAQEWVSHGERIMLLRGQCRIRQGDTTMRSRQMVVWERQSPARDGSAWRIDVYLEDEVGIDSPGRSDIDTRRIVSLHTREGATFQLARPAVSQDGSADPVFRRASSLREGADRSALRPTELAVPGQAAAGPELRVVQLQPQQAQIRRIQIFPRSAIPYNVVSFQSPHTTPPEQVWVITGGVVVLVHGLDRFDTVDLAADRAVIWTRPDSEGDFRSERLQSSDQPFQVYLEGNIVIRQGQHVLRASHGYYDAQEEQALLYNAELKAFVPDLNGSIRVQAERLRQLSRDSFHGQNAWVSSSVSGRPGYRLQSSDIFFENRLTEPWMRLGPAPLDPLTGAPLAEPVPWITTLNNTFRVEDYPLLYYPYLSAPADDPGIPLSRAQVGNDRIFGFQVRTAWNMFKVAGLEEPPGVDWDLLLDYYSDRGPAVGTEGKYLGADMFGLPGLARGDGLLYYIHDTGFDRLGRGRNRLPLEDENRFRATWRHRQEFPSGLLGIAELGYLTDRNFYEQYWEDEYDTQKDVETLLYATQSQDNAAWSALLRPELNDFWNTTQWLRGDGHVLSEPLFDGLLTWSTHTSAAYADLHPADRPFSPLEAYTPLPYMPDVEGGVLMTRHLLDAPFNLGPVQVVPYLMGEGAYWGEGMTGDAIDRYLYSAGVKSSFMVWRPYPWVQNRIFGLNGLAHKMVFEAGYSVTEATRDLSEIAQYNPFDDISQLHMRERIPTTTFDGTLPATFDPRFYAVRTGTGLDLTAPYHELVEDQQLLQLAWRHRLQTKVGPPERLRIKDWMLLDLEASYFPNEDRDNFGEDFGLLGARYRWNVGDRTSLLAGSRYDLFDDAQELWDVGVLSQRSTRGSIYLGLRQVKGATLDSKIVTASYSYQMGPKWVSTFRTSFDLEASQNRSQSLTITRIGADFLFHLGLNYNENKDNAGVAFMITPRIGPFANGTANLSSLTNSLSGGRR
ncbi:MAG: hypothetical protein WD069_19570 [Planctomycetales bacterium]